MVKVSSQTDRVELGVGQFRGSRVWRKEDEEEGKRGGKNIFAENLGT